MRFYAILWTFSDGGTLKTSGERPFNEEMVLAQAERINAGKPFGIVSAKRETNTRGEWREVAL